MKANLSKIQIVLTASMIIFLTACAPPLTGTDQQTPTSVPTTIVLPTAVPFTPTSIASSPTPFATQTPIVETSQPEFTPTVVSTTVTSNNLSRLVILIPPGESLPVYQQADPESPVIAHIPGNARVLLATGQERIIDGKAWVDLPAADGQIGWVDAYYLTEDIPQSAFCADARIPDLLDSLAQALITKDGEALKSLISPVHGLRLHEYHTGIPANYSLEEAGWIFKSTYVNNWGMHPARGEDIKGTFSAVVLPDLLDVFQNKYELFCIEPKTGPVNYEAAWPYEYANIQYYSVYKPGSPGVDLDWRTWVAGIEYVKGKPYVFSLIQFFWEP